MSNAPRLNALSKLCALWLVVLAVALLMRATSWTHIAPGWVGVRYNNFSGVSETDLGPGTAYAVPGVHRIFELPGYYLFLNYAGKSALSVRTKDNNTVTVDVSIPYRIKPGDAWRLAKDGNHTREGIENYRFQRFAKQAANDVLLAELAKLSSESFYDTTARQEVANQALEALNSKLDQFHLEADSVLIRQAYFREEYETQLAQIQLNEQTKLLDAARGKVALAQQELDTYHNGTQALSAASEQNWARRVADLERAYMVGVFEDENHDAQNSPRERLAALTDENRPEFRKRASETLGIADAELQDEHLLGIKNIEAETKRYRASVKAQADGIAARLDAEGEAMLAQIQADYESRINLLLATPAGRAYVAYEAASHIKFAPNLTFSSNEGVPSVYRLREFARKFMGDSR